MTSTTTLPVTTAVIPAAGLGTRFLPLTKSQPKEMLPIVDKPAIQYVVEEAVQAGITNILVITGRGKRAIEDHFDRNFELEHALHQAGKLKELEALEEIESLANIHYVRQRDPRGLGHAVSVARTYVGNEPFAVMLGDDIMVDDSKLLKEMKLDYETSGSSVLGLMEVEPQEISSYGCVAFQDKTSDDALIKVESVVEKPSQESAPSNIAIIGRYIFSPEIFECIDHVIPGVNGEIQLTDAISLLIKEQDVFGRILDNGRFDVGQKKEWLLANVSIALKREDLNGEFREGLEAILNAE